MKYEISRFRSSHSLILINMGSKLSSKATFILGHNKSDVILMYHTVWKALKDFQICYEAPTSDAKSFWVILNPTPEQALSILERYYEQVNIHLCFVFDKRVTPSLDLIDKVKTFDFNRIVINPCNYHQSATKLKAIYDMRYAYYIRLMGVSNMLLFMKELLGSIGIKRNVMFHAHEGRMALMINSNPDNTRFYRLYSNIKVTDDNGILNTIPEFQWCQDHNKPIIPDNLPSDKAELIRLYLSLDELTPDLMKRHFATFGGGVISDAQLKETYLDYITTQLTITGLKDLVEQELEGYKQL